MQGDMEPLREFHINEGLGRAACGVHVAWEPAHAYATHLAEVTCVRCLSIICARVLGASVAQLEVLQSA